MVCYKKTCNRVVAARIMHEAICSFLQGTPWEQEILMALQLEEELNGAGGGGDDQVRDDPVIPEEPPVVEVASGGDEHSAVGGSSPVPSRRSEGTSASATFIRCREKFNIDFKKLSDNTTSAPKAKMHKASIL